MHKTAILELAIETLEGRKTAIDAEIAELRAQIGGGSSSGRRGLSQAQRAAQSRRMKAIWKQRKAKPAKKARAVKKSRSAAARKAQSKKMKAWWAKRKAAAKG